ncbi:MAG: S8 family serine peptidase, partial [Myxococcota bacterium]|nr:S8 family serine peptidase [Myxococcota bacterium]
MIVRIAALLFFSARRHTARERRSLLSLPLFLLLSSSAIPPTAEAGQGLIVRLQGEGRHAVLQSAEHVFKAGHAFSSHTADGSDSLDRLHRDLGVRQIRALFRADESGKLQEQRARFRSRFARGKRTRRAPSAPWPDISHIYQIELPEGANLQEAQEIYSRDPHVAWVQQDHTHQLDALPNDPYLSSSGSWGQDFEDLWALHRIKAPEVWSISQGEGVVVAVVDTGVDYTHPDIAANIWLNEGEDLNHNGQVDPTDFNGIDDDGNGFIDDLRGFDFAGSVDYDGDGLYNGPLDESDPDPFDDRGHGTHVAGIIGAVGDNGIGIIGVAPKARIMPLKGFPAEGSGKDSDLWAAVLYAALNGADVINNSWSCRPSCPENPLAEEILAITRGLGVVVVTSAGNSQMDAVINSPENLQDVITVGSSDYHDENSTDITNFGWVVDLMAPGGGPNTASGVRVARRNILSLRSSGDPSDDFVVDEIYLRWAGTSMAAPQVSGVVALLKAQRPELEYESIRRILRQSAFDIEEAGHDYKSGAGRLDARAALETTLPAMTARLDIPRNWELYMRGAEVIIHGAVQGADLETWSVEVGRGNSPSTWQTLSSSDYAEEGELARWDTAEFEQGAYVIRLRAHSQTGHTFFEFRQISLESNSFVRLSSPGQPAGSPDVAYPWVVWSSARDPKEPWTEQEDQDLFLTNIRTGRELAIWQAPGKQNAASISTRGRKSILSWKTQAMGQNSSEIQGCGFSSRNVDCNAFEVSGDPTVFGETRAMGGHIVWLQTVEGQRQLLSCKVSSNGRSCE